ncbi:MAG: hypothetical protein ACTMIL_12740 [Brevibacterium aurantiacum]
MTTDAFTTAARAAAERDWGTTVRAQRPAFIAGARWARDHLAAQEPTDAECVAVLNVKYGGTVGPHDEPYDAEEMAEARAALIDAKEARS